VLPETVRFRREDIRFRSEFDLLGAASMAPLTPDMVVTIEGDAFVCVEDGLGMSCVLESFNENLCKGV